MPATLATGAEELLIALQTPAPRGFTGVPTLVWGQPGEGKTTFIESFARDNFPVVSLIASIHDPTDFSGLPIHEDGRVRFVPPEWALEFEASGEGILLLDELTTAPPSVQAALLRVVLERKVGTKSLPKGVRIAAAANPPDAVVGGWELSPPLANRFVHVKWQLGGAAFANALQEGFAKAPLPVVDSDLHRESVGYWRLLTAAFLRRDPSAAHTRPAEGEYAFASPRTWDYAIQLMASCDVLNKSARPGGKGSAVFYNLLEGSVGSGAAKSFIGFLKDLRLPDPEKVLDGKEQVNVAKLNDDELFVFFCALAGSLNRRRLGKRDHFLDATLTMLALVDQVNAISRVDAVFAPVRQMARGQVLQRAALAAQQSGRIREFQQLVKKVFEGTPLAHYVGMLGDSHDA
jgi:hypothetical protein